MKDRITTVHNEDQFNNSFLKDTGEIKLKLNSVDDFPHFPTDWLIQRIREVLEDQQQVEASYPQLQPDSFFMKLITEHELSAEETVLITLALAATFSPEFLNPLKTAALEPNSGACIGGFFFKGMPNFVPTIRTAVFLLSGNNLRLRAKYSAYFHSKQRVFTTGIVTTEQRNSGSVFLDHQLIFSDQFLGAILQGDLPRLDSDTGFPVKRSNAIHTMSDVVLKEKTMLEIDKLRRFARNMKQLWAINETKKVRSNFISIFSGDPGTGKSHAAEAIGNEFDFPVYKVNFAQMVSKYIGETEKNLEKVFDRFDKQPCILFFDEAESIFSKRTEVGDSHDQHANNLQSYLLQKVEEFSGIIILATNVHNLTHYFDKAFQRRFRLIVEFEFPDYPERLRIWNKALFGPFLFEEGLTERLANQYQFSGGSIYNIVSDAVIEALDKNVQLITFELIEPLLKDEFKKTSRKSEVCTDEMLAVNPAKRYGLGYEKRQNF